MMSARDPLLAKKASKIQAAVNDLLLQMDANDAAGIEPPFDSKTAYRLRSTLGSMESAEVAQLMSQVINRWDEDLVAEYQEQITLLSQELPDLKVNLAAEFDQISELTPTVEAPLPPRSRDRESLEAVVMEESAMESEFGGSVNDSEIIITRDNAERRMAETSKPDAATVSPPKEPSKMSALTFTVIEKSKTEKDPRTRNKLFAIQNALARMVQTEATHSSSVSITEGIEYLRGRPGYEAVVKELVNISAAPVSEASPAQVTASTPGFAAWIPAPIRSAVLPVVNFFRGWMNLPPVVESIPAQESRLENVEETLEVPVKGSVLEFEALELDEHAVVIPVNASLNDAQIDAAAESILDDIYDAPEQEIDGWVENPALGNLGPEFSHATVVNVDAEITELRHRTSQAVESRHLQFDMSEVEEAGSRRSAEVVQRRRPLLPINIQYGFEDAIAAEPEESKNKEVAGVVAGNPVSNEDLDAQVVTIAGKLNELLVPGTKTANAVIELKEDMQQGKRNRGATISAMARVVDAHRKDYPVIEPRERRTHTDLGVEVGKLLKIRDQGPQPTPEYLTLISSIETYIGKLDARLKENPENQKVKTRLDTVKIILQDLTDNKYAEPKDRLATLHDNQEKFSEATKKDTNIKKAAQAIKQRTGHGVAETIKTQFKTAIAELSQQEKAQTKPAKDSRPFSVPRPTRGPRSPGGS